METEANEAEGRSRNACPLCALWAAYRNSEAARHVRGLQREALLLVRSVLDTCIKGAEKRPAPKSPPTPGTEA